MNASARVVELGTKTVERMQPIFLITLIINMIFEVSLHRHGPGPNIVRCSGGLWFLGRRADISCDRQYSTYEECEDVEGSHRLTSKVYDRPQMRITDLRRVAYRIQATMAQNEK